MSTDAPVKEKTEQDESAKTKKLNAKQLQHQLDLANARIKELQSVDNRTLIQRIADVMKTIEPMHKSERAGNDNWGYNFVSVNQMLDKARPALADAGIIMLGDVISYERYETANGKQIMMYLTVEWKVFLETENEDRDYIAFTTIGEAADNGDKAANKAYTAAQKQAVSKLLMMSGTDDDPDREIIEREEQTPPRQQQRQVSAPPKKNKREIARETALAALTSLEQNKGAWPKIISNLVPDLEGKKSNQYTASEWDAVTNAVNARIAGQTAADEEAALMNQDGEPEGEPDTPEAAAVNAEAVPDDLKAQVAQIAAERGIEQKEEVEHDPNDFMNEGESESQ